MIPLLTKQQPHPKKSPTWFRIPLFVIALLGLLALATFNQHDPGWWHAYWQAHPAKLHNAVGLIGCLFADLMLRGVGVASYLLPIIWLLMAISDGPYYLKQLLGGFIITVPVAVMIASIPLTCPLPAGWGGWLGQSIWQKLSTYFGRDGSDIVLLAIITMLWLELWPNGVNRVIVAAKFVARYLMCRLTSCYRWIGHFMKAKHRITSQLQQSKALTVSNSPKKSTQLANSSIELDEMEVPADLVEDSSASLSETTIIKTKSMAIKPVYHHRSHIKQTINSNSVSGSLPALSLLAPPELQEKKEVDAEYLEMQARQIEMHLADFGIQAEVILTRPGPVITRFELSLASGVKVSKITTLAKDLARSLAVVSVRVVEIIPGTSNIGLEVPATLRQTVRLRDVLEQESERVAQMALPLALGCDISGRPIVVDLGRMPHLLVAGTTGSGKSVGINAMLLSLLLRATPEEIRFLMVDPKMLELSAYQNIPHLLAPVVTDMKEAAQALAWCVAEMERRYRLMAAIGVRQLSSLNEKIKQAIEAGEPLQDPTIQKNPFTEEEIAYLQPLPQIVMVIDEFADLIMVVGKKIEELIARLAQKARASGMHLILATQRPSVDVITGLIKANIPARIAFQVSSRIDSRTILDQQGAEQLLGAGDMLYLAAGQGIPTRVHGAFVADDEVHAVADDWRSRGAPDYALNLHAELNVSGYGSLTNDENQLDELFDSAVAWIAEQRRISVSALQRKFKIGFNRAARIVEQMEEQGVVSAPNNQGNREVLLPPANFD